MEKSSIRRLKVQGLKTKADCRLLWQEILQPEYLAREFTETRPNDRTAFHRGLKSALIAAAATAPASRQGTGSQPPISRFDRSQR